MFLGWMHFSRNCRKLPNFIKPFILILRTSSSPLTQTMLLGIKKWIMKIPRNVFDNCIWIISNNTSRKKYLDFPIKILTVIKNVRMKCHLGWGSFFVKTSATTISKNSWGNLCMIFHRIPLDNSRLNHWIKSHASISGGIPELISKYVPSSSKIYNGIPGFLKEFREEFVIEYLYELLEESLEEFLKKLLEKFPQESLEK